MLSSTYHFTTMFRYKALLIRLSFVFAVESYHDLREINYMVLSSAGFFFLFPYNKTGHLCELLLIAYFVIIFFCLAIALPACDYLV